jgi:NAD(P)-dependent dehydrogenase (short-subunit alcohol dehydrogenase family)
VVLLDQDGKLAAEAAGELGKARAWACDVSRRTQVAAVFAEVQAALGPVDALVNNAGIWQHTPVREVGEEEWDRVFAVNVKGILWCCQAVAPEMIRRRAGKIVNVASVAGFGGNGDWSAYCASKAAAISLTLAWAEALAEKGIQVNAVCPGATQTPLLEQIQREEPGATFDWVHRPEEVAEEVVKLVCPWAQMTSGQVVAMKPAASALGIPVR